jgi:CheY-like chemotaxis protein
VASEEFQKKTILIVDDEIDLREILAYEFTRQGYNVLLAANGEEAYNIVVKPECVDLILTDVQMPHWDGVRLLKEIKKLNPRLPVVMFVTGFAKVSAEEAYDMGAEALFDKPFDKNILFTAVKKALELNVDNKVERRHTRVESQLSVVFKLNDCENSFEATIMNLGRGGALIKMHNDPPKVKQGMTFTITLSEATPVVIKGSAIVRWVRPNSSADLPSAYGVEFAEFEKDCRADFFSLLNGLKTTSYIPRTP